MKNRSFADEVLGADIETECVELVKELVPIGQPECGNSLDPEVPGGCEKAVAEHMAKLLSELGLSVELVADVPDRPNVIGILDGSAEGPTLILNDHLDTYPAGDYALWTETNGNPFNPTVKDRWIYSRGTSDTRGNLATIIMALRLLKRRDVRLKGKIVCAFTVDEEKNGKHGAVFLLQKLGLTGDYELTAEPSGWTNSAHDWGMGIAVAHSGHCLLDVTIHGTPSHLWRPDVGINANEMMALFINGLKDMSFTYTDPAIKGPTGPRALVVRMEGGKLGEGQFTPSHAKARLAIVGLVPGMTHDSVLADVERYIQSISDNYPDFRGEATKLEGETFVAATAEVDNPEHLAKLREAYRQVLGKEPLIYRKNAYCDTIRFSHAGIPSLTFGPGEDGWAPINEAIHIDKVVAASKILTLTIYGLLGAHAPSEEGAIT